ncbi:UPF0378-like protein [Aphelenchoides fujianensis]|nr:UPF0378-like protein [Aphelenchoides fujianensis]
MIVWLTILAVLAATCYFVYQYINNVLAVLVGRFFKCKNVSLHGVSFLRVGHAKLQYECYDVELQNIRLRFTMFNFEAASRLFHLSVGDVRVEKRSSAAERPRASAPPAREVDEPAEEEVFAEETDASSKTPNRNVARLFYCLQYVNVHVGAARIVLLDDVPDCLLHVTLEGLHLDTYRDREGLQLELQFKLVQTKLFMRNPLKRVSLLDFQLAGAVSVDVAERAQRVKKLGLKLKNTKISVSDLIFEYVLLHPPKRRSAARSSSTSFFTRCLEQCPTVDVDLDCFTVEFVAVVGANSTRTLSAQLQKIKADFNAKNRSGVAKFGDLHIGDHQASSQFKCIQFLVALNRRGRLSTGAVDRDMSFDADDAAADEFDANGGSHSMVEVRLGKPQLDLYNYDLAWWMDYIRTQPLAEIRALLRRPAAPRIPATQRFPPATPKVEEAEARTAVFFQLELTGLQCLLRVRDGPVIVVGVETAELKGDHRFQSVEFGVESLWCHRSLQTEFPRSLSQLSFEQHTFGTTVAIGAGCAQLTRPSRYSNRVQIYVQLDECQFEWEDAVMRHLVEYIRLFRTPAKANVPSASELPSKHSSEQPAEEARPRVPLEIHVQLAAKKLSLFFTAKNSAFIVASIASLRVDFENRFTALSPPPPTSAASSTVGPPADFAAEPPASSSTAAAATFTVNTTIDGVRLGTGELDHRHPLPCCWWTGPRRIHVVEGGGCARLSVRFVSRPQARVLVIEAADSFDLCWSPLGYAVFYEVLSSFRQLLRLLRRERPPAAAFAATSTPNSSAASSPPPVPPPAAPPLDIRVRSEHPVGVDFQLPRDRLMRWITPSLQFERTSGGAIRLAAPTFLLELDNHIIMTLESPCFERRPMVAAMDLARRDFKKRADRTNRCWTWSTKALELSFPYGYNFAAAYEEIVNAFKWMKRVHRDGRQAAGAEESAVVQESPLPSDLNIVIQTATLSLEDDPFESRLQLAYETALDEAFERERRRQMLDAKVEQLKREDPTLSKSKVDALYQSLVKKDAQIYVERINKLKKQNQRHLLAWQLKNFDLKAFADRSLHGKENVVRCIRTYNPESAFPTDGMEFSILWARDVVLDVGESRIQFRDYPLLYQHVQDAHFWGTLCGAEQSAGQRSMRETLVELPAPWGTYRLERNMCPLKFYYDLECEITDFRTTYGPCWEPCLSMISLCWRLVNAPSRDPSSPLAFWDKIRLLLHGRFLMFTKRLSTSMLASPDPYNDTELVEISWENFEFEWLTGEFRIHTDLDAYIRTASKYDDSRLLHLPQLKFFIQLNWACMNDQHDHHSVHPVAPNKLPDYTTNGGHDSYRAFRSSHLDVVLQFEVKPYQSNDNQCPQILFYSNTFKWLEVMKNTLTMVNRPIKRGKIFNEVGSRRQQLSRHFKNIQLNLTLPRFLISYWMSFSSSYGFRTISDSLCLTSSLVLHSPTHSASGPSTSAQPTGGEGADGVLRRSRTAWKVSHVSVQLENAQVHLYGETRKPTTSQTNFADSDESFFIGLSRLNYVRESKANKLTTSVLAKHKRTASYSAKGANTSRNGVEASGGAAGGAKDAPPTAVHRLTIHDFRASWTAENRDTCLAIADGVQKAYLLRKVLSNDAMKMFQFSEPDVQQFENFVQNKNRAAFAERFEQRRASKTSNFTSPPTSNASPAKGGDPGALGTVEESEAMLWKLINEAETNLVAYSEETVEPPNNSLLGMALCTTDDVVLTNWQVDLLNSQMVLKGHETDGFILVSAARASITQRFHVPVWKDAQLLLKRSFTALLSGMQYFAPLSIGFAALPPPPLVHSSSASTLNLEATGGEQERPADGAPTRARHRQFQWLTRDIIEEKNPAVPNDKINNYSSSGEAVGGVVTTTSTQADRKSSFRDASNEVTTTCQLQRVASRCSCQLFFCYYSDLINMEKFEDFVVPQLGDEQKDESPYGSRREDVDCFTLKHNMLEVSTNAEQYRVILDIVNNLVLFVDPKKKKAQERRRRLWFELVRKAKAEVKICVQNRQKELRELGAVIRGLERQSFYLNKQIQQRPNDLALSAELESLQAEVDEQKRKQIGLIDDLAQTISVFKEKTVDEQTEEHRRWRHDQQQQNNTTEEENVIEIARRFEVCFEDCVWRLTEHDGQISITEVQIRNFLYNRTARIDSSGEHLLEIGTVKVLNLLPNSKYKETLCRLPKQEGGGAESEKTPSIRVICRERAPVGGISVKEHFEVNIAPMQAQLTSRFFNKMMDFFFPGRELSDAPTAPAPADPEAASGAPSGAGGLAVDEHPPAAASSSSSHKSLWFSKRFRGAAYNSFRSQKPAANEREKAARQPGDEIDRMKERADKNILFVYINITSVPFVVSYKSSKDKSWADRIGLILPQFEVHEQNWTWLDLSMAIKKMYRNALVQQFMKTKLLRKAIHERTHSPANEPIGEEEKKRIVLGTPLPPAVSSKKNKKK